MSTWLGLPVRQAILSGDCRFPSGFDSAPEGFIKDVVSRVTDGIATAVNVRIDNVTEYLFAGTDKEDWGVDDFPNQAPPFESMWFETKAPSRIVTSRAEQKRVANRTARLKSENVAGFDPDSICWGILYKAIAREDDPPETRWEVHMTYFRKDNTGTIGPLAQWRQMVSEDGVAFSEGEVLVDMAYVNALKSAVMDGEDPVRVAVDVVSPAFFPVKLAISFMHCKNVKSAEVLPSRQIRRQEDRKGKERVRYHVLDIMPMRTVLETEGKSATVGVQKALHICRGHFSNYSEDRPLFGKYAGRFWISSHVRGKAESGVVMKDYNVKAPEAA